ncbi:hypothetical protein C8R46DRAFT_1004420 [Mycena filopes]|nr:hypothetical protein C8R46DRAFT_1004420 [Mycena filopes]
MTDSIARVLSLPLDMDVLQRERATLLKAISALDSRRNELAPISKLSPELLSEIFLIVAAHSRLSAAHPEYLSAAEVRRCTVGVCHHWRAVARSTAHLWGYIDFARDSPERVQEALENSKVTQLVVQANLCSSTYGLRSVLLALEHLPRIECLDLSFKASEYSSFLAPRFVEAAPALAVLRLYCEHEILLPSGIFAGATPRLRELELRGCMMSNDSPLLRNLTYLSVDDVPEAGTFTVLQWLVILESLPLLQVLSLSRCFSPPEQRPLELPLVHLPYLFSLALAGCTEACADTLSHLSFPPTPCLEIKCLQGETAAEVAAIPILIETLGNMLEALPPTQRLRTLGLDWRPEGRTNGVKFRASTDAGGDVSPGSDDAEFYLAIMPDPLPFLLTMAVLGVFPTADVVVLDLGTPLCDCPPPAHWAFSPADDWAGLLTRFPAVHTLRGIQYDWATAVLGMLAPPPLAEKAKDTAVGAAAESGVPPRREDGDDNVLLPALHTLSFVNTAFDIPAIMPSLLHLVRTRLEGGRQIKYIHADFCTNALSKVQMLHAAGVEKVFWDGQNSFQGKERYSPCCRGLGGGLGRWP